MNTKATIVRIVLLGSALVFASCSSEGNKREGDGEAKRKPAKTTDELPLGSESLEIEPLDQSGVKNLGKFVEISSKISGVDFTNNWPVDFHPELPGSFITAGVAVGDFNQDGLPDFFAARRSDGGRLYQNLGEFKFKDVTEQFGLDLDGLWGSGATFADINNDGRLDLAVCGLDSPNRVFINQGERFEDQASELGLDYEGPSIVMSFCDYDRDGDLDAHLLTNRSSADPKPKVQDRYDETGTPIVPRELGETIFYVRHPDGHYVRERAGRYDYLFRNEGDRFVDVTRESGLSSQAFFGLSSTWWDYNDDGWPDLFVSNDFKGPDHLFRNNGVGDDGIVSFTDVAMNAFPHTPWFSMGSDIADINNDGLMDLLATDMAGTNHYRDKLSMGQMSGPDSLAWFLNASRPPQYMRNSLFVNTGTERFMEAAYLTGLALTDWTWTVRFSDFDQDGWQDVYFTNGMSRDWFNGDLIAKAKRYHDNAGGGARGIKVGYEYWNLTPKFNLENLAFRNKGQFQFENVSTAWGLDHSGVSTGGATADFDNDGDLDIVINGFDEPLKIYRNDVATGNCLKIYLMGRISNRQAIGSKIVLETTDAEGATRSQLRYLNSNQGIMSSSEPVVHFGVGEAEKLSRLEVTWPSGIKQEFTDIASNQLIGITEPAEKSKITSAVVNNQSTLFKLSNDVVTAAAKHEEITFDDFAHQPLIPNKYSQLGPGMSWGDIDGDGDHDGFMGNGRGSLPRLLLNENGMLEVSRQAFFEDDQEIEDMGSLFFDADSDGDLDLYVVSGSGEAHTNPEFFQDRLYLNDGSGTFTRGTKQWLPAITASGSCVVGSDFDRDGDVDLFVGGRIVPGQYPSAPRSYLLVNDGEKLVDLTQELAADVAAAGMVTAAVWSDVNNDDWIDLLVSYEWGPVRLFLNSKGKLVDATVDSGLSNYLGWFNSVSSGDIDNDGDVDFVVGNFGLNTKYHATEQKPELLYYGDFDKSGRKHIVEAKFEGEVCLPRRGLGCTSHAMPIVKEKLPTFHEFAISPLEDIYSNELIENATRYEVNLLESFVLINNSDPSAVSFEVLPLPRIAQVSPIFGTALVDVDGDEWLDLVVAQNFHGPQRETGYMDGGVSLILRGDGSGEFAPIWPNESGFVVAGDATCLTVVDLNRDHKPDLVVGINDNLPVYFQNESKSSMRSISLVGPPGNRNAIGTRVTVFFEDGTIRAYDINVGGSYLSQSPSDIFVSGKKIQKIEVIWSNGHRDQVANPVFSENKLVLNHKSASGE